MSRPEFLAALIFTMDDGPFVGLPSDLDEAGTEIEAFTVSPEIDLRLIRTSREGEPWVMQGLRDDHVLWSRVVSGRPQAFVSRAYFVDAPAVDLGDYGWRVPFFVDWAYGREQAHLYLDREGELRFYFLSW